MLSETKAKLWSFKIAYTENQEQSSTPHC